MVINSSIIALFNIINTAWDFNCMRSLYYIHTFDDPQAIYFVNMYLIDLFDCFLLQIGVQFLDLC